MPGPSFPTTPVDLKLQLDAERNGLPCAVFHNDTRRQHIVTVDSVRDYLTIAPAASDARCHSRGDEKVSRPHVRLKPSGGCWILHDAGFSRHGTYINGERVSGHRVPKDRDERRVGATDARFRAPAPRQPSTVI